MNRIVLLALATIPVCYPTAYASMAEPTLEEICAATFCRPDAVLTIALDADSYVEIDIGGRPIAYGLDINLYLGEEVYIEATLNDGVIDSLEFVETNQNPDRTISVRFARMGDDRYDSMLVVENPFDQMLRYRAFIATPDKPEFAYTSSCPVMPGVSAYEHWPYAIFHIVMAEVHLRPAPESNGEEIELTCE